MRRLRAAFEIATPAEHAAPRERALETICLEGQFQAAARSIFGVVVVSGDSSRKRFLPPDATARLVPRACDKDPSVV
jgi:hypothetical protein